jgi:DNA processing protein
MFDGPSTPDLDPPNAGARLGWPQPRIGPVKFHEALQHFGSARAACRDLPVVPSEIRAKSRRSANWAALLIVGDADYPRRWRPARRTARPVGDRRCRLPARPARWRSSVRARPRSPAGASRRPRRRARAGGFAIASGLARGIDAAAHEAALDDRHDAVLAGGIDQVYPPQNASCSTPSPNAGCCWPRTPLGTPPSPAPSRGATASSAACRRVVVIEAAERSGSLITAELAAEQGRRFSSCPARRWTRAMADPIPYPDGAILVRDANDIISVFGCRSRRASR